MTSPLPSIAMLGAGSMGGAILAGLRSPSAPANGGVRVTTRSAESAARIPGATSMDASQDANKDAVRGARIVVLGVKPAMVPDVLRDIAPALEPDAIVISLAVGVTTATMEAITPGAVIRAMPNTPSLVGRGVTGLAPGSRAKDSDLALAVAVFETVGTVLTVPESQLDALSTISGSGPAYVFLLIEELTKTAVKLGFTESQAATLVNGTFGGATELLAASEDSPAELRRRVTSPKGTTEQAIEVLQSADLSSLFDRATAAALARAAEIAAGA
jgi:pyrroline-5-carboxylate reductase